MVPAGTCAVVASVSWTMVVAARAIVVAVVVGRSARAVVPAISVVIVWMGGLTVVLVAVVFVSAWAVIPAIECS